MLKLYFKVVEDQTIYTTEDPKKKICKMKNEENKIQTDRKEILKISTRFYTELYSSTPQDQHPPLKMINPDSSEVPPIMTSEVEKTPKEMKNNTAPGIDNLASDIMILGGEESVKKLTQIFNQILETKTKQNKQKKKKTTKKQKQKQKNPPAEWKETKLIILH